MPQASHNFRNLLSGRSLPGWGILGWTMLSTGSSLQFAIFVFDWANEFLKAHPLVGFVIGIGWLLLVVTWPEWKHVLGVSGRSAEERLQSVETSLEELHKQSEGIASWLERTDILRTLDRLQSRITALEKKINP